MPYPNAPLHHTVRPRLSNMEALRLLAMFMVMAVHANFKALGRPTAAEVAAMPVEAWTRFTLEAAALVCVDVFVLLSGWFGIRPKLKGLAALLFQTVTLSLMAYGMAVWMGWLTPSSDLLLHALYPGYHLWFIPAYIGLYLLAPVLNAFVGSSTPRAHGGVVVAFALFIAAYAFKHDLARLNNGYHFAFFIFLYLLGRFARLHGSRLTNMPRHVLLLGYVTCTLCTTYLLYLSGQPAMGETGLWARALCLNYMSPFVVGGALCLVVLFARMPFSSKAVNKAAASCLAIYIIHCSPGCSTFFHDTVKSLYGAYSGPVCLLAILLALVAMACVCLLLDCPRLLLWNWLVRQAERIPLKRLALRWRRWQRGGE